MKRVNLKLTEELHKKLTIYCALNGVKIQIFLEKMIQEFIKEDK